MRKTHRPWLAGWLLGLATLAGAWAAEPSSPTTTLAKSGTVQTEPLIGTDQSVDIGSGNTSIHAIGTFGVAQAFLNATNFTSLGAFNPTTNVVVDLTTGQMSNGASFQGVSYTQAGTKLLVFAFTSFTLNAGQTLTFVHDGTGTAAVALLSQGDMTIDGTIDVGGHAGLTSPGTGSYLLFDGPGGPDGANGDAGPGVGSFGSSNGGLAGGGGGGFGGSGGHGGGSFGNHGLGGAAYGAELSSQLLGGSGGATGAAIGAALYGGGGGGGGALQLGALGTIDISGQVVANGGWGGAPSSTFGNGGGGGGGSGGAILVQAGTLTLRPGATISASGGGGGSSHIANADVGGGGGGGGQVYLAYRYTGVTNGTITAAGGLGGYGGVNWPNNATNIGADGTYGTVVVVQSDLVPASPPVNNTPTISGFTPASGPPGTLVTINGTNFVSITNVQFGGVSAGFLVLSSTQLWATPPAGASSGPIQLVTRQGTVASANAFTVTTGANDPPTVHFDFPDPGSVWSEHSFLVGATATDPDGSISHMDYYAGGNQVYGLDTIQLRTVESSFTWNNVNFGRYVLTVVVTDDGGAKAISPPLLVTVAPRLQIGVSGPNVIVSWPADAAGFLLESTRSLAPPINWAADGTAPVIVGNQSQVTENWAGTKFYRLRRPQ